VIHQTLTSRGKRQELDKMKSEITLSPDTEGCLGRAELANNHSPHPKTLQRILKIANEVLRNWAISVVLLPVQL